MSCSFTVSVAFTGCGYEQVNGGCGPSRQISCETLKRNLMDFGVQLCAKEIEELCAFLDQCNTGQIVAGNLFDIIRPKLSRARVEVIEDVYRNIDTDDDGCISLTDVMVGHRSLISYHNYHNIDISAL